MKSFVPDALRAYYDDWHFSPAVESGGFLFLSGVTGTHPDGGIAEQPEEQFVQAFETLALVLEAAQADFGDVVEMTTYHVGLRRHLDLFRRVKDRYIRPPYPAWTAIGVEELAVEAALVEIRIVCRANKLTDRGPPG